MEHDTKQAQWSTADQNSFAHTSARDRWPIILTQAIDDVHKAVSRNEDLAAQTEGKSLISQLAALKYELQHNRTLSPLPDDGRPDIAGYNAELAARSPLNWFDAPWLFSECYLYRRMASIFLLSTHWKSYDYFSAIKTSTFRSSRAAVLELAAKYTSIVTQLSSPTATSNLSATQREEADKILFTEMVEICLWGNATDLSLLASASYVDIASLQGAEARRKAEKNILVNDVGKAFDALRRVKHSSSSSERRVDIVLDNSGFELFVDLVLAGYLIHAGLATTVVFHPKDIPWFVSDVVPKDFAGLFGALLQGESFFDDKDKPLSEGDKANLAALANDWAMLHAEGKFVLRPNGFWTEGGSFWRLPATAPRLYEDLKESELVFFKGDLNYRKLTADGTWHATTPFETAIGPLGKGSGLRVLALRTCKGDVVAGLPAGKDEELRAMENGGGDSGARKWAWTGKWAVIEYCDGKA
ncbi:DUF89 domain-containing protein [Myriangium duriaei CBS 260.36]|uniref:Sugar phosphate phosphatase n=1 Tax=Myriangium duriaei CBS 260.36 TaxID=1168546 RepID=A0A9P4MKU8_9PEZI|nr:DUF89 domain-containing protein [Myriangium duriaei CBS 260.36]